MLFPHLHHSHISISNPVTLTRPWTRAIHTTLNSFPLIIFMPISFQIQLNIVAALMWDSSCSTLWFNRRSRWWRGEDHMHQYAVRPYSTHYPLNLVAALPNGSGLPGRTTNLSNTLGSTSRSNRELKVLTVPSKLLLLYPNSDSQDGAVQTSWCQKPQDAIKRSFCPWAHRSQVFWWHDLQNFKQLVLLLRLISAAKYNYEAGIMCVFRSVTVLQMHRFDGSPSEGNEYVIVCLLAG